MPRSFNWQLSDAMAHALEIASEGRTQERLALDIGATQGDVCRVLGDTLGLGRVSVHRVADWINRLGYDVEVTVRKRA